MQQLKRYYRKNGYDYHLEKRGPHTASQADGKRTVAYEVGYIKCQKNDTTLPSGQIAPAGERFWSNEDIGRIAWSIRDLTRATERYDELVATSEARRLELMAAQATEEAGDTTTSN